MFEFSYFEEIVFFLSFCELLLHHLGKGVFRNCKYFFCFCFIFLDCVWNDMIERIFFFYILPYGNSAKPCGRWIIPKWQNFSFFFENFFQSRNAKVVRHIWFHRPKGKKKQKICTFGILHVPRGVGEFLKDYLCFFLFRNNIYEWFRIDSNALV